MSHCSLFCRILLTLCWASLAPASLLSAAEIRLKGACQPAGSVLLLGDVAEIFSTNAEEVAKLAALPLTPAPAPGAKRFLRGREIQDMLVSHDVNLADLRFSGANQVTIETLLPVNVVAPKVRVEPKPVTAGSLVPPQEIATEAIAQYLQLVSGEEAPWLVKVQLTVAQQQVLRSATGNLVVGGGSAPWFGKQQFEVQIPTDKGLVQLPLQAEVRTAQAVVTVIRALPKGSILRAEDLKLVEPASHDHVVRVESTFHDLENVIGKETQRAVSPGQVLDSNYVRSPILVRKGEVVTVYARAAGIRVRTTGRSLSDGSEGELIVIETLETGRREKFDARVAGAQVVEVWAGSIAGGK